MKSYILDSSQCTRVVLTDPGLGRSGRSLWIREQLAVLYPGSIEDLVWDFRLNKRELVLYYMNRDQLAGIRGSRGKCRIRYGGDKREI
ncbi:MAG: hypothetical protein PQJ50_00120, partial [Spirochaetales bacterium]|nr:hypothetical protein [Spirochaetales bacterium]